MPICAERGESRCPGLWQCYGLPVSLLYNLRGPVCARLLGNRSLQGLASVQAIGKSDLDPSLPATENGAADSRERKWEVVGDGAVDGISHGAGRTWKLGGMMGMFTFLIAKTGSSFDVKQLVEIRVSSVANAYYLSSRTTLGEKAGSDSCSKSHRTEPA